MDSERLTSLTITCDVHDLSVVRTSSQLSRDKVLFIYVVIYGLLSVAVNQRTLFNIHW